MAWTASIETETGAVATYFHISGYVVYARDKAVDVQVVGYASEAARQAGRTPLIVLPDLRLSFEEVGSTEPTREQIYGSAEAKVAAMQGQAEALRASIAARDETRRNSSYRLENRLVDAQHVRTVVRYDGTVAAGEGPTDGERLVLENPWLGLVNARGA